VTNARQSLSKGADVVVSPGQQAFERRVNVWPQFTVALRLNPQAEGPGAMQGQQTRGRRSRRSISGRSDAESGTRAGEAGQEGIFIRSRVWGLRDATGNWGRRGPR
jgi:hypothetical protein